MIRILMLTTLLFFQSGSRPDQPNLRTEKQQEKQSEQNQGQVRVQPTPLQSVNPVLSGNQRTDDAQDAKSRLNPFPFLKLVPILLIALQVLIFGGQYRVMRRTQEAIEKQGNVMQGQLDAMKEQGRLMDDTLTQSKRAIDVSKQQADTTQESFYKLERAYVGLNRITCDLQRGFADGPKELYFELGFVNAGRTPAWNFKARAQMILADEPPSDVSWNETQSVAGVEFSFLAPGDRKTLPFPQTVFDFPADNDGPKLFIVGDMFYRDIAGKERSDPIRALYIPATEQFDAYQQEKEETGDPSANLLA